MAFSISTAARNAAADGLTALFDAGTGRVNVYTGAKPATPQTAAIGTLLATLTLATDAAGAASAGVAIFNAITSDTTADASGTAGWFRVYNSDETVPGSVGTATDARLDGTCSSQEGTGDMKFTDRGLTPGNELVAGGIVAISGFSVNMPASA